MSIGERRERVSITRKTRTQTASGSYTTATAVIATRWASVKPVRGSETEQSGRKEGSTTYMLEFDARGADIRPDDFLVWVTNSNLAMNVREVRKPDRRAMPLVVIADSGAVIGG